MHGMHLTNGSVLWSISASSRAFDQRIIFQLINEVHRGSNAYVEWVYDARLAVSQFFEENTGRRDELQRTNEDLSEY